MGAASENPCRQNFASLCQLLNALSFITYLHLSAEESWFAGRWHYSESPVHSFPASILAIFVDLVPSVCGKSARRNNFPQSLERVV